MIINSDFLEEFYYRIPIKSLENFLIDTWFIDDYPNIYKSTFFYAKSHNLLDRNFMKLMKALENSSRNLYNTFEIEELSLVYRYPPQDLFEYIGRIIEPEMWKRSSTSVQLIDNNQNWNDLDWIFENHKRKYFQSLFFEINCNLNIFDNQRNLQNRVLTQAVQIAISHNENRLDSGKTEPKLNQSFSLSIALRFWSLLKEDNREDIMMIYLCHLGLLKCGTTKNREIIGTLLEIGELNEIAKQARKFGLIEVTEEEYYFYECSILVLPDQDKLYLRDNRELAEINRPIFLDFIEQLEQDFKPKSRQLFSVWL